MKFIRLILIVIAAALIAWGLNGNVMAFHDGGVAHCDGCHTMHSSADNPPGGTVTEALLKGTDPSSTCLNCHAGGWESRINYHIFSDNGGVLSPGGDFFWLTQDYQVEIRPGTFEDFEGQNMGHNVVATDYGLTADSANTAAPGGSFLNTDLSCVSCHSPHGESEGGTRGGAAAISGSGSYSDPDPTDGSRLGKYRLLRDANDAPPGASSWPNPAPVAVADGSTSAGRYTETDTSYVAYMDGMSEWCANCHTAYLNDPNKHPAQATLGSLFNNYNSYVATGNFTGSQSTSYLPLVPFEHNDPVRTNGLDYPTSGAGPTNGTATVMCLTCHRAHASAFNNATRWQTETEFLSDQIPTTTEIPAMANDNVPYYGRDIIGGTYFGTEWQRQLCNKCHVQD